MAQIVGVSVKEFIMLSNKLGPSNISLTGSFSPLPPLPTFLIEMENTIPECYRYELTERGGGESVSVDY